MVSRKIGLKRIKLNNLAGLSSFALVHCGLQTSRNDIDVDEPSHVCYPIVGCFDNEYPYDCLGTRNLPCEFYFQSQKLKQLETSLHRLTLYLFQPIQQK